MRFKGKVALITGGNSGIGAATARLFAAEGASVVIVGRSESRGNRVLAEIQAAGGEALWIACDVRKAEEARRAVQWTQREFGRLDILFNNAGIILRKNVIEMSEEEWDNNLDTNLKSAFLFAKYALPIMIAGTEAQKQKYLPKLATGDTVRVAARVVEGGKERVQVFEGTVMRLRGGGIGRSITVRKIASGVGVERTFKVNSPRIEKIDVVRHGQVRRAQLYFLRKRVGKAATLRERRTRS